MLSMESGLGGMLWQYINTVQLSLSTLDQWKSAITVTDFPDYVLRMTEEDEHNNSLLAQEYHVYIFTHL